MNSFLSDFFNGIFGNYTFSGNLTNVLYGDFPKFSFILGQLVALSIIYLLIRTSIRKIQEKLNIQSSNIIEILKEAWSRKRIVLSELFTTFLLVVVFLFFLVTRTISDIRLFSEFSHPAETFVEGQIVQLHIEKGGRWSFSATIDALFVDENGESYSIHLINADKQLANNLLDDTVEYYDAFIALNDKGELLYINEFAGN